MLDGLTVGSCRTCSGEWAVLQHAVGNTGECAAKDVDIKFVYIYI